MLFPEYTNQRIFDFYNPLRNSSSKENKPRFSMWRVALRVSRTMRRIPWGRVALLPSIILIYQFIQSQKAAEELRERLHQSMKLHKGVISGSNNNNKEPPVVQPAAADHDLSETLVQLASDQFKNVNDQKALKIIVAKKKELDELQLRVSAKALIVSNWKNGCDLIGDILSQHPGAYYHYEPLAFYGVKRLADEFQDEMATNILRSLFKCSYGPSLDNHKQDFINDQELMIHNKHLWPHCRKYGWRAWCLKEEFLDSLCSLFPVQLMKTTRVRLSVVADLLQDSKLKDLKIVLLIRDPRAVMHSRSGAHWCQESRFCREDSYLCEDLEKDFEKLNELKADFPGRVTALRYEDFAAQPRAEILQLAAFLGMTATEDIEAYLDRKLDSNDKLLAHSADTSSNVWQSQMHFGTIEKIQNQCQSAMANWGYKMFTYEDVHPNRAVLPLDIQPKIVTGHIRPKNESEEEGPGGLL